MNDLSATDIILFGVLSGALALTLLGLLWAMAYQGRKRWSVSRCERCSAAARLAQVGHGGS